jgi:hypothetical protein
MKDSDSKYVIRGFDVEVKADGVDDNSPLGFVLSTKTQDRMRDTINQAGWRIDNYLKNPVMLWAHSRELPPIARAIDVKLTKSKLIAKAQFTPQDMPHPLGMGFGHTVGRMYREIFLNTVSVGFRPEKWAFNDKTGGVDFEEQELLEFSAVPVPANPEALYDAKIKGIDTSSIYRWCEHALDTGETLMLPVEKIEAAYKVLRGIHDTTRGAKIEVDVDEVVGVFDRIKNWVTPKKVEPAIEKDEAMDKDEQTEVTADVSPVAKLCDATAELVDTVDKLTQRVKSLEDEIEQLRTPPIKTVLVPDPPPEPEKSQTELMIELMTSPDIKDELREMVTGIVRGKICEVTGELS